MVEDARVRDDRGTALVEFIWLGLILTLPLIWIVVAVFEVQRGAFATSGAARAAGRAYVLAGSDALGQHRAEVAARQAVADQGGTGPISVGVSCAPYPAQCHSGGSTVTVRVDNRVDLPLLPSILGGGAPSFPVTASHTVPVGRYQEMTGASH